MKQAFALAALGLLALVPAVPARAQFPGGPPPPPPGVPPILRDVGYDQKLGDTVPGDIVLRDETGQDVPLSRFLGRKPVVLSLVYYECPMLCTLTLNGLLGALKGMNLTAGQEFDIVTVSFEPKETPALAAAKKASYVERYQRPGAEKGWHFLTGEKASIERLTRAVGFRYAWDAKASQYAHPSGLVVLTPEGRISRYLYGVEYAPKDLRFGLVESSAGRIGTAIDRMALLCYQYDPSTGRYSTTLLGVLRLASVATVVALGTFMTVMLRRDRLARPEAQPEHGSVGD